MPWSVVAAGVSAAGSLIGGKLQSDAISKGQSQSNAAIQQGIQIATNQLSRLAGRQAARRRTCPGRQSAGAERPAGD